MITGYGILSMNLVFLITFILNRATHPGSSLGLNLIYLQQILVFHILLGVKLMSLNQPLKTHPVLFLFYCENSLYTKKNVLLEIHLSETLAHLLIMIDQSQIKGKTVSTVPIYKGPYSITRSEIRKKFFSLKPSSLENSVYVLK